MYAAEDAPLATRVQAAYAAMFVAVACAAPHPQIAEDGGLILVGPGAALPRYNAAFLLEPPADIAATLAAGKDFFGALGNGWMLKAYGDVARTVDAAARAAGMAPEDEPGMALVGPPKALPPTPELAITPVSNVPALWAFDRTMQIGFDSSLPIASPEVMNSGALLRVAGLRFFHGTVNGEPAGTATVFVWHGVACIADISVVPAMRRRGYGAALTAHAVNQSRLVSSDVAYLEASAMGEPVYQRIGFREVFRAHGWLARPH